MAKAKVGDLVRITNASPDDVFYVGDTGIVQEALGDDVYVQFAEEGSAHLVWADEYEVISQESPKDYVENQSERIDRLFGVERGEQSQADAVNSPPHYTQGKHEVIDIIEFVTQGYDDSFVGYCVGNTVKYVARAPFKHGTPAEDLRKAAWYLTKAADYIEKDAR